MNQMNKNQAYSIIIKSVPLVLAIYFFGQAMFSFVNLQGEKYFTGETTGVMSQTKIIEEDDSDSSGKSKGLITYKVNKKEYTAHFTLDGERHNGDKISVFYNPDDPSDSASFPDHPQETDCPP